MKISNPIPQLKPVSLFLILLFTLGISISIKGQENYKQYSGKVIDSETANPLVFASLSIDDSNISTVTNTSGEFLLKVPSDIQSTQIIIAFLGYETKIILLSNLKSEKNTISLIASATRLPEINIVLPNNAKSLVIKALRKKKENNLNDRVIMTGFYRETIKKRKKNVSLAEAIVNIYKQPYTSVKKDVIKLYKARKSTDYKKLDTLALKLQGGPFNPLYIDLMKYPEYMFTDDIMSFYNFSFGQSTIINEKPVYVINFKQRKDVAEPLYYGKLYIDTNTLAIISASYNLNVENKELTSNLFVKKRPKDVFVYPTVAAYRVDYREKNGKWYYGYSNVNLTFKIKRKGKWFNSIYSLSSEMAVTDWKLNTIKENVKQKERLRPSVIIADEASGFSDPEFWGSYNVIEPEKSIESAINKIKRQLKKMNKS